MRVFKIIRMTLFWTFIVVLAFLVLSFLVVRINGGTPSVFGYTVQRVTSGSMEPTLKIGDIILSREVSDVSTLKVDDIITFKGNKYYDFKNVTHRIVEAPVKDGEGVYHLTTRGDANDINDNPITGDKVESKFIAKIDLLQSFYDFFLSPWGLVIFIGVLLAIFFDEILNIARILTGNIEDEKEEKEESISQIIKRIQQEEKEKSNKKKEPEQPDKEEEPELTDKEEPEITEEDVAETGDEK